MGLRGNKRRNSSRTSGNTYYWLHLVHRTLLLRFPVWPLSFSSHNAMQWGNHHIWWHDNRFEVNWPPEPTLVLRWISKFFLFGALPSDTLKIKHTKNLKEIPSRDALENLPENACMNAFIHLKLISNLQGFYQYIMADMLIITRANYENIPGSFF